jgi:tRNA threonylcarbamoyladenosine biosynthesis protein TsaE
MDLLAHSLADLPSLAIHLLETLNGRKIIAFHGQMGAGKTTFVQAILRAMGIEEAEGSPTYSLVNVYESPFYGTVNHMDLYRLNELEEAYDIGLEEMIYGNQVNLIEWPDIIEPLLPEETMHVFIEINPQGDRRIYWDLDEKN